METTDWVGTIIVTGIIVGGIAQCHHADMSARKIEDPRISCLRHARWEHQPKCMEMKVEPRKQAAEK